MRRLSVRYNVILAISILLLVAGCADKENDLSRPAAGTIILQLPTATGPEGLIVHGDSLYVCETGLDYPTYGAGKIRVYNCNTLELVDSVQVGANAQFAAVDSVGRLHVVCTGDYSGIAGQIYVISLETLEVLQVLDIGGSPNTVSFGGGYTYVAAGGFEPNPGLVYRYRLSDLTIINDASNPIVTGQGATDVEAREDGGFYVSCFETDEVQQFDSNGVLIHTYSLSDGPSYMVMTEDSMYGDVKLYVVQGNDESLAEINLTSGVVNSHVLNLGLWCNDIIAGATSFFVANSGDNTIQEIDRLSLLTLRVLPTEPGTNPWSVAVLNDDMLAVTCFASREVIIMYR